MGLVLGQSFSSSLKDQELTFVGETPDEELAMFLIRHAMMQNGVVFELEQEPKTKGKEANEGRHTTLQSKKS